jgi:TRAP-type C4-dicarboxylate transport system permease small subunit
MNIRNWVWTVFRGLYSVSTEVAAWIGHILVAGITLLVFINVCGRYLLRSPITGTYEIVEETMVVLGGLAIMYCTVEWGHVTIDILVAKFPKRTQIIMQSIFSLLGSGIWGVVAYGVYLHALSVMRSSRAMASIPQVSVAPFQFILAAGLFLCSLTFLIQAFHPKGAGGNHGEQEVNGQWTQN